ncbi:lipopolysaccharide biosynthesis protein [Sporosarcina jiandibaonis]|uniref:lipopolysaccharide biosynthesis protein n=1 Tax=Sporosarcina jiandibaonis TaxID=2715535 RepID=UPI001553E839|nr:oligosaccharide flippase family protein [Sporosarcina jiandibaonis]
MTKKLFISDFNRNVLTLLTGTTIAQAIPIAISPILTRLYSPQDFGVLALFVAITTILASVANGRYELAIVLPKTDKEALSIMILSLIISTTLSLVLLISIFVFYNPIVSLINNEELAKWLYFIPIVVFLAGLYNSLNYYNTRKKAYSNIAKATVIRSVGLSVVQISLGLLKKGAGGLITGQVISQALANGRLAITVVKDKNLLKTANKTSVLSVAKRYNNFPKFSLPAVLMNTLASNILNFFLPIMFSVATLGQYALVNRILGAPSSIIGNSFGQVFLQQATSERLATGKAIKTFTSTLKKLFILAIIPFTVLFFFGEDIIVFVFGSEWIMAGQLISILAPYFFVRFISSPLSTTTSVFEKNQYALVIQSTYLILIIIICLIGGILKIKLTLFLTFFSGIFSAFYLILIMIFYRISKNDR